MILLALMIPENLHWLVNVWLLLASVACLVMIPIVVHQRSPMSAMAWLLIIFFRPEIGIPLYLLLARHHLAAKRSKAYRRMVGQVDTVDPLHAIVQLPPIEQQLAVQPEVDPYCRPLAFLVEKVGGLPILGGNTVNFVTDSQVLTDQLLDAIGRAEHHIHMLYYIFLPDNVGRQIAHALIQAQQRGVQCRVLVDAVGSSGLFKHQIGELMRHVGVELHEMLPVNLIRKKLERIDLRNHRKLAVFDGKVAWTGSQNITDATDEPSHLELMDMTARIEGPCVLNLQRVFMEDWYFTTGNLLNDAHYFPKPRVTGDVPIQVVPSGPIYPTEGFAHLMVEAIHTARRRLIITTPYLAPDEASLTALKLAVLRGVQVDMVIPRHTDHPLVQACAEGYYEDLLEAGVNVYLYQHGLLHAKTFTVDDQLAMVGSGNFDIRSFYLNFELNLLMHGSQATSRLRFLQQHYIDGSVYLTERVWNRRPKLRRLYQDVAKLFTPLF